MGIFIDFYKRVWGDGDITNEIEVTSDNNLITYTMTDGTIYEVGVPLGKYKYNDIARKADIVDEFNKQLQSAGVPITTVVGGVRGDNRKYNCIVFKSINDNPLKDVSGSFMNLFLESQ